jgi:hypothetical protein
MTTVAGLLVFQDVIKICYDCHLWPYISLALMSGYGLLCECSTPLLLIWWYVSQIRAQFFLDYICTFWSTPSIWRNDSTIPPLLQFWAKKILFFFFYMYFFLSNFYLCKQEYSEKVLQMTKHSLIFFSHVIQMGKGFNCRKSKLHLIMPIIYFFTNSYKLTMILLDDVPCLCLFQQKKKKGETFLVKWGRLFN